MSYLKRAGALAPKTQMEQATPEQVRNNAGGFVFEVDRWERLRRFLILGTEGNTYYQSERDITSQNVDNVHACIVEDGLRVVQELSAISTEGRAPKNDPAILVLALCASADDEKVRAAALDALPVVCRIGTHLFMFAEFALGSGARENALRGGGRALRRALGEWYTEKSPQQVAYQAIKYRQRNGWTHRDILRKAKPSHRSAAMAPVLDFIVGKGEAYNKPLPDQDADAMRTIIGFRAAQESKTAAETAFLVREYGLPREALNPEHLTDARVWDSLLHAGSGMPLTAMIRNLGNMSKVGTLTVMSEAERTVCAALRDQDVIRKARVHPISILTALAIYAQGHGMRGSGEWTPVPNVVDALNDAFYLAFGNVEPTGKRTLIACDVSGSMQSGSVGGSPVTPIMGAAALALVTKAVEPNSSIFAFSSGFKPWDITPKQRLDDVIAKAYNMPFDSTDCAQPMLYATKYSLEVDTFVVITDNETWAGRVHPYKALEDYRKRSGIDARLAVIGMTATDFTIANPKDAGMMDFVGFDTAVPEILRQFSLGLI